MKKNNFSHNKNKNNKPSSIPNKKNINKSSSEPKNEIIPIIDLLKCPICKNICLMDIDKDKLLFSFECNSKHQSKLKKSKTYINSENNILKTNLSESNNCVIENSNIRNKDNNTSNHKGSNDSSEGKKKFFTENDFFCPKHPNSKYQIYCYECKENICDECSREHIQHNKVVLTSIKPKEVEIINYKNNVKKTEDELNNLIENIMKWKKVFEFGLNTIIKIMQNILNLKQFIIMNYDFKQTNQNYNYIQNFNNMKSMGVIFPELEEFLKSNDWKRKGHILIDSIISIQNKIIKNRENMEINNNKEEEISEKAKSSEEIKENNILRSKKKELDLEEKKDKRSIATGDINKNKNYNTIFSSDCMNNYFSNVSTKKISQSENIKMRNKNKNEYNAPSHTIEQNKELEKDLYNKDNNRKINKENKSENESNLNSNMKNLVESKIKTTNNDNKEENQPINSNEYNADNAYCNTEYNNIINDNKYNTIERNQDLVNNKSIQSEKINPNKYNESITMEINNNSDKKENSKNKDGINEVGNLRNKPKKLYKNIELKYELANTDMIRSIEFTKNNHVLICTLENLGIYKINPNYELEKLYDIKEYNYRMNYCSQLSNGNIVICSLNTIDIINLLEDNDSISYTLNQQLKGKINSYNINKVIEIREKNYLISCDKNNLIIFSKNEETNLYQELKYINTNSETKCLEQINENLFVTIEPEEECVIFYEIENLQNKKTVKDIQSSFGRYAISYIPKNNCIFVTGKQGIYLISTKTFNYIKFFNIDEWISSINLDFYNNYLICGTWKKNSINEEKIYNLIVYEVKENNINLIEKKNDIHSNDIVAIKPSEKGMILTGSNDRTVKLWI